MLYEIGVKKMQNKRWMRVGALVMALIMGFGVVASAVFTILGA